MDWPIKWDEKEEDLIWSNHYAPSVLQDYNLNVNQLSNLIQKYKITFPAKKTKLGIKKLNSPKSFKLWLFLMGILIPFLWLLAIMRIFAVLVSNNIGILGLQITLILFLFLSFNFALCGIYGLYRRYQNKLDLVDQLDLLKNFHLNSKEIEKLNEIIVERKEKLYWKKFKPSWDLNDLFPTLTIIDFIAIFSAIFNQVYIIIWLFSLVNVFRRGSDLGINSIYFLGIDLLIGLTVILFVIHGINFGKNHLHNFNFETDEGQKFVNNHIRIMFVSILIMVIYDLIFLQFNLIFLIIIFFGQIPLYAAFVTAKSLYLRQFIHVKTALIRQLKFKITKIEDSEKDSVILSYYQNKLQNIQNRSFLPTTQLRSFFLVGTGIVSIFIPIITGLISSTDRFVEILALLIPN